MTIVRTERFGSHMLQMTCPITGRGDSESEFVIDTGVYIDQIGNLGLSAEGARELGKAAGMYTEEEVQFIHDELSEEKTELLARIAQLESELDELSVYVPAIERLKDVASLVISDDDDF